jgi:4'-phosphopantetheinyl transferase
MEKHCCKIYFAHFATPLPPESYALLLAQLPEMMQKKVKAFRKWEDRHASLLGKHILQYAIKENGQSHTLDNLQYTAAARPYFHDNRHDFNISHTDKLVVCAIANDNRIGIDIERPFPLDIEELRRQFSDAEWEHIQRSSDPLRTFYEYWTAKEAMLKASGTGLTDDLHLLNPFENNEWQLYTIRDFSPYLCHVASQRPLDKINLINVGDSFYQEPAIFLK